MIYNIKQIDWNKYNVFSFNEDGTITEEKKEFYNYFYVEKTSKANNIIERYKDLIQEIKDFKYEIDGSNYLKIYLKKPIFESKDLIYGLKNYGCKIYENDITQEQQFIYENNIEILKEGVLRTNIPYVVFDIEVETKPGVFPSPERDFIFYIGAKGVNNKKEDVEFYRSVANYESNPEDYAKGEEKMLNDFLEFLDKNKFIIISGYNIYNFDIYFIAERLKKYGKTFSFNDDELVFEPDTRDKNGISRHPLGGTKNIIKYRKFVSKKGRLAIFDIYFYLYRMPTTMRDIRYQYGSLTLKNVSDFFNLIKKEKRQMIVGDEIYTEFIKNPNIVKDYLIADVESTYMLYSKFIVNMLFLSNVANISLYKIFDASSTQILESALIKETKHEHLFIPQKTYEKISEDAIKNYGGGYTEIHAKGYFENVSKADFSSLYPSIMLDWKIKPKNDNFGIFTKTLEKIYTRRIEYKHKFKELTESKERPENYEDLVTFYKSSSDALKILINSAYGLLGFRRGDTPASRFTDLNAASQVTSIGRNMITSVEDVLLKNGFTLIETDTDGAYITKIGLSYDEVYKQTSEIVDKINATFKELGKRFVKIDFEDMFDAMVSVKKKNYFLIVGGKEHPTIIMHGSKFVNSSDPKVAKDIINDIVKDILINKLSMEELNKKYEYLFISSPLKPEKDFISTYNKKPELFTKVLRVKSLSDYSEKIDIAAKRLLMLYYKEHGFYPLDGTDISYYYTAVGGEAQRDKISLSSSVDPRKIDYKKYLKDIKQKFIEIILDVYDTELIDSQKVKIGDKGKVEIRKSASNPYYTKLFDKDWMVKFFTKITDKRRQVILTTYKNHTIRGISLKSIFGEYLVKLINPEWAKGYYEFLDEKIKTLSDSERQNILNKYKIYTATKDDKSSINYIKIMNDMNEEEIVMFNTDRFKNLLAQQSLQETQQSKV